jgi:hypothetical protein
MNTVDSSVGNHIGNLENYVKFLKEFISVLPSPISLTSDLNQKIKPDVCLISCLESTFLREHCLRCVFGGS